MESIQIFNYEGSNVTFKNENGIVFVNLTEIAKAFPDKNLSQIVQSSEIQEYIRELSDIYNYISADLLRVIKGGYPNEQGTWAHQRVALRVCQKLSTKFSVWVDEKIEELLTTGVALASDDDAMIMRAMEVLQNRLESKQRQLKEAECKVYQQQEIIEIKNSEIKELLPDAEYTRETLKSVSTFTTTQIAKELGLSAVTLNKKLRDCSIQYNVNSQWVLYAKYQDKGYVETSTYTETKDGITKTYHLTVWTEAGRRFIHDLLKNSKAA